ncbi:hypothetical protein LTR95_013736 [Oleoguttula sp. CCFEE 5521]
MPDPRLPPQLPQLYTGAATSNKRLAPPHPAETPAKKKQSKWTADEDASIIELRGNGMKWEDISKQLPGRSAISCRLRFQNYLERRSEWDEEKKNKLARLYERFKKDMWEKISKEMALPWRAAEAMHWQIGEIEMAQRANVPVFHLAGQALSASSNTPSSGLLVDIRGSTSPPSHSGTSAGYYSHGRGLPQPISPDMLRLGRTGDIDLLSRQRADSARSMASACGAARAPMLPLPSLGEMRDGGPRYMLPPVVTSAEMGRR